MFSASLQPTLRRADWDDPVQDATQVLLLYRQQEPGQRSLRLLAKLGITAKHRTLWPHDQVEAATLVGFDMILYEADNTDMAEIRATLTWVRTSSKAPLVVLMNVAHAEQMLMALAAGADAVLTPPMKPALVVAHCRALLRRWQHGGHPQSIVAAVTASQ